MSSRRTNVILTILFLLGLPLTIWAHDVLETKTTPPPVPAAPQRIVSLAPSITETLFALGQGDQIAAVSQYCVYPPQAQSLPKVAGFSDINFEAVLRQRPDLVVLPIDKTANQKELERLGITVMTLDTRNLKGFLRTVQELGAATGHQTEARQVQDRIMEAIAQAELMAAGRPRPTVLFSVMHSYQGFGYITEITAVGQDGFFSELIDIAGGENLYKGPLSFPKLSREAIMTLNPSIIVDLIQGTEQVDQALSDWKGLTTVDAVKNDKLFLFTDQSDTVPGPRIYLTITKLSQALQPQAWAQASQDAQALTITE
ncbi:MAG: helical backbone metal receptor [Deltaproteobacteria bacterium]|jgi:iron complex transport system substrate-binding protein|nr:helical backbone metal receptor [Deltaproteobacteria bacterium]